MLESALSGMKDERFFLYPCQNSCNTICLYLTPYKLVNRTNSAPSQVIQLYIAGNSLPSTVTKYITLGQMQNSAVTAIYQMSTGNIFLGYVLQKIVCFTMIKSLPYSAIHHDKVLLLY